MKKSYKKILSVFLSAAMFMPVTIWAKDYSYDIYYIPQDFSQYTDFADTGFSGYASETLTGENPWILTKADSGETILKAELETGQKAYLTVGREDWTDYTVTVNFKIIPADEAKKARVSLYTRSKGGFHTWKEGTYFRYRFDSPANYSNFFACWHKENDNATEAIFSDWYSKDAAARPAFGEMQTLTAQVKNTPAANDKIVISQQITLNGTFAGSKSGTFAKNSNLASGKVGLEFYLESGGAIELYSIAVTGTKVDELEFIRDDSSTLQEITPDSDIYTRTDVGMRENGDFPVLISALYQGDRLIDIDKQTAEFAGGNTAALRVSVATGQDIENVYVRSFLWNGFVGMEPMTAPATLGTEYIPAAEFPAGMTITEMGKIQIRAEAQAPSTILVIGPDCAAEDFDGMNRAKLLDNLVYIGQAEEAGVLNLECDASGLDKYGAYTAVIRGDDGSIQTLTANYADPDLLERTIDELNQADEAQIDSKAYIDGIAHIIGIDLDKMKALKDSTGVYGAILKNRPYAKDKLDVLYNVYENAILYQTFNESEGEAMVAFLAANESVLGLEKMANYTAYAAMTAEEKQAVCQVLNQLKPIESFDKVAQTLDGSIILTVVNKKSYTWQGYEKMLRDNQHIIGINMNDYDNRVSSANRKIIMNTMKEITFADIDAIAEKFNELVDKYKGTGGGSGGGSSPSPGASVTGGISNMGIVGKTDHKVLEQEPVETLVSKLFPDMQGYAWAKESVEALADKRVITGNEDGKFEPGRTITRDEFVKILVSAFSLLDKNAKCAFTDVEDGQWYYPYIASAVKTGLVKGVDAENFGVGMPVTRQDIAVIVGRYLNTIQLDREPEQQKTEFTDMEDIAAYAKDSVALLAGYRILNGNMEKQFLPRANATRAEAAVIIYKLMEITGQPEKEE